MKNLIALLLVVSCAIPGIPNAKYRFEKSMTDGNELHIVEPASVLAIDGSSPSYFNIGLKRTPTQKDITLILHSYIIKNFHDLESLIVNIDGKITKFKGNFNIYSPSRDAYGNTIFVQEYNVSKEFIETMMKGNKVFIKLILRDSYLEGDFTAAGSYPDMMAKAGFANFLKNAYLDKN